MSCLGGTPAHPLPWRRFRPDGTVERVDGRICNRASPRTSRRSCSGCPAFRGLRWDGMVANGLGADGMTPIGLTDDEARRYDAALEARLVDDDDGPLWTFYARQDRELVVLPDGRHRVVTGIGERGLLRIGDPDALDRHAAYMRDYRAARPGSDKRRRQRSRAGYMKAYRERRCNPVSTLSTRAQGGNE